VVRGKPPVEFTGAITSVATNTLPYEITVKGSSNSNQRNAPKGTATFEIASACRIKNADGSAGSFGDLATGRSIGISYSRGIGGAYEANAIDLNPAPSKHQTDNSAKRKRK
jgi:hypothetical protein